MDTAVLEGVHDKIGCLGRHEQPLDVPQVEFHRRSSVPAVIGKFFLVFLNLGIDFRFGCLAALEQFVQCLGAIDLLLVVRLFRLLSDLFSGVFFR